jgi:hypothetical protein
MKTTAVALLSVVVAGLLVVLGWCLGDRNRLQAQSDVVHAIDSSVLRAQIAAKHLDELQSGNIAATRDDLAVQLYGNVMMIDLYFDQAHPAWRESALEILTLVANHRSQWSSNYASQLAQDADKATKARLDSILTRAKAGSK